MKIKLHLHANEKEWNAFLNGQIDTLVGLNEEVLVEGLTFHEKQYKGNIRDDFFVAKSKHIISDFKTYNPRIIHGDFESIGSNVELELTVSSSDNKRSQQQNAFLFIVLPLILIVGILFKKEEDPLKYVVLTVCSLIPIVYHLVQRWLQFTTLRHFIRKIEKEIKTANIPL